jgi:hypothetical protein
MKNLKTFDSINESVQDKYRVKKDFIISVRSADSTLNHERGRRQMEFKSGDVITFSVQSGSLGELWSVNNLSSGDSGSYWRHDYSTKFEHMDKVERHSGPVTSRKSNQTKPIRKETTKLEPMSVEELESQTEPTHQVVGKLDDLLYKGDLVYYDEPGESVVVIKGRNPQMIVSLMPGDERILKPINANESNYQDPTEFENVDGIDVSLTMLRKALKISIGDSHVELSKDDAIEIMQAIEKAVRRM